MCFRNDRRLSHTAVLRPNWITSGVYRILTELEKEKKDQFSVPDLKRLLKDGHYVQKEADFIIDMMKKFELCFKVDHEERFLVPTLLTENEPTFNWRSEDVTLRFRYDYDFLPPSIISRFIVKAHSLIDSWYYWRYGVVLFQGASRARIKVNRYLKRTQVEVCGPTAEAHALLSQVRVFFHWIHQTVPGIEVKEMVPVPGQVEKAIDFQLLCRLESEGHTTYPYDAISEPAHVNQMLMGILPTPKEIVSPTPVTSVRKSSL